MNTDITKIRDILIDADSVYCNAVDFEYAEAPNKTALYKVPIGHTVTINFNKMAAAIYDAGYRLLSDTADNGEESKND